jgi:hypothetical protein
LPAWSSLTGGYGSGASWADLDLDGDLDLATGRWWGSVKIYENTGGNLTGSSVWDSATSSVIENLFWEDVDNDGLRADGFTSATGDGARTLVKLGRFPVRSVDAVRVGGSLLPPSAYAVHLAGGWVSLADPPMPGQAITVAYSWSHDLDLGVTNWDEEVGNYLFRNTSSLTAVPGRPAALAALRAQPNPLRERTVIRYLGEGAPRASLAIYDVQGRRVRSLHEGPMAGGLLTWEWDGRDDAGSRVAGGIYFARLAAGGRAGTVKLAVLR